MGSRFSGSRTILGDDVFMNPCESLLRGNKVITIVGLTEWTKMHLYDKYTYWVTREHNCVQVICVHIYILHILNIYTNKPIHANTWTCAQTFTSICIQKWRRVFSFQRFVFLVSLINPKSSYWNDIIERAAWKTGTEPLNIAKLGVVNVNGSRVYYYDGRYDMNTLSYSRPRHK